MPFRHLLLGSLAVFAISGEAFAAGEDQASVEQTDRTIYTVADFSQYAPVNALDMVRRIPGFSVQSDDSGNRGFGQARGNVLINGQRVSAKSNGAEAVLGRIAAVRVVQIEVLDGTQTDIPGLSGKVVNVVTDGEGTVDGRWSWKSRPKAPWPNACGPLVRASRTSRASGRRGMPAKAKPPRRPCSRRSASGSRTCP